MKFCIFTPTPQREKLGGFLVANFLSDFPKEKWLKICHSPKPPKSSPHLPRQGKKFITWNSLWGRLHVTNPKELRVPSRKGPSGHLQVARIVIDAQKRPPAVEPSIAVEDAVENRGLKKVFVPKLVLKQSPESHSTTSRAVETPETVLNEAVSDSHLCLNPEIGRDRGLRDRAPFCRRGPFAIERAEGFAKGLVWAPPTGWRNGHSVDARAPLRWSQSSRSWVVRKPARASRRHHTLEAQQRYFSSKCSLSSLCLSQSEGPNNERKFFCADFLNNPKPKAPCRTKHTSRSKFPRRSAFTTAL